MSKKPTQEAWVQRGEDLEQALLQSEKRFQILLKNSSDIQVILDQKGTEKYISESVEAITGYPPSEFIGKNGFDFVHPDDKDALRGRFEKLVKNEGASMHAEYRHRKKDGSWLHLEAVAMNLLKDPAIEGIVLNVRDVSRQKEAEQALFESESRLRSTFRAAPVGLAIVRDRKFLAVNEAYCDIIGYGESELIGRTTRMLYESEEEGIRVGRALYKQMWSEKSVSSTETRHITKTGTIRDIMLRASPVNAKDASKGVLVTIADVTEQRRVLKALQNSEERYRSIVENIQEGYYEVDIAGNFISFNDSMCRILGYDKKEMMGLNNRKYTDEANQKKLYRAFNKVYREGTPAKGFDWKIIRKDGTVRVLEASVAPIRDAASKPVGFRGIVRDVTEAIETKDRLLRAEKMETVGTLAGGVAHDLNNLLSGVVSYPELLLMRLPEDSPHRKPLETIKKSGEKAVAVVQDLLTLARRAVMPSEPVDVNQMVRQFLSSPEFQQLNKYAPGVTVDVNLDDSEGLTITGSAVHLSKTLMNLVNNGMEAMSEGGRMVITTEKCYLDSPVAGYDTIEEGDYVVLSIMDSGTGIASEDLARIFEPFYTKKKMGRSGTGLGMAVVWGTIKDHKGFIDVLSRVGEGTTFKLYFPLTRKVSTAADRISGDDYRGKGEFILVVDDVAEQRELAADMLAQLGYMVHAVSGGEEAVEYLKAHRVDLLLLDMIMEPGMDGLETYRNIIQLHPGQKAVIASGFSETKRVREVQRLGAGSYIKKPFLMENLGRAVKETLCK